jgi:hypothetical protein
MQEPLDGDLLVKESFSYLEAFKWWESKRLKYNLIVGLSGFLPLLFSGVFFIRDIGAIALFICVAWAIMANLCYFSGWLLEAFDWKLLKTNLSFFHNRPLLFILMLVFSVLLSGGLSLIISIAIILERW